MSKVTFDIKGVSHNLYFGMDAYEIVAEMSFKATVENNVSNFKMCSYIIYGGMVNHCVLKETAKPLYEDAYLLMQEIVQESEEFQNMIFSAWDESVANKMLTKVLDADKKKAEAESVSG